MAYTKQTWADLPSKTTPINANRLTHIEDGIFNAAQTADTAASTAGTAAANVGIVSSKVETLTERVNGLDTAVSNKVDKVAGKGLSTNDYNNTDKGKVDSLGTASTKNSTSVVTESSDLVESGAVFDTLRDTEVIEGKNLYDGEQDINFGSAYNLRTITITFKKPIGAGTYTLNYKATGNGSMLSQISYDDSFHKSSEVPYTFIVTQSCDKIYLYMAQDDYDANKMALLSEIQIEKGSQATAYQPYCIPLKDALPNKCDNSVIGTVEDGTNPTKSYEVDEFMVRDGAFCQVTAPVTTSSTWTEGSNYTKKSIAEVLQSLMS